MKQNINKHINGLISQLGSYQDQKPEIYPSIENLPLIEPKQLPNVFLFQLKSIINRLEQSDEIEEYLIDIYQWNVEFIKQLEKLREIDLDILEAASSIKKLIKHNIIDRLKSDLENKINDLQCNINELLNNNKNITTPGLIKLRQFPWQELPSAQGIQDLKNIHQILINETATTRLSFIKKIIRFISTILFQLSIFTRYFKNKGLFEKQRVKYNTVKQAQVALNHHLQTIKQHRHYPHLNKIESKQQNKTLINIEKKSYLNQKGIPTQQENITKPRATYPVRMTNSIIHYNNTSDNADGTQGAYADMIQAIKNAEHVIFIAGWLFEPQYCFPNNSSSGKNPDSPITLGELLVAKALAHPKMEIAILVWNQLEPSSDHANAYNYLKEIAIEKGANDLPSNLQLRYVRRSGFINSHHQKFIVTDTKDGSERTLAAFCGSADLAGGHFDWFEHPILDTEENKGIVTKLFKETDHFRTLAPTFNHFTPRTPWREVVTQVKGLLAFDMLSEFVSRWGGGNEGAWSSLVGSKDPDNRITQFYSQMTKKKLFSFTSTKENKNEKPLWNAQVIRSGDAFNYSFPWKLDRPYEKSIHKAYLQAIKQAEKFIYIETQYLTGGTAITHSKNRVPQAIVNRIIEQYKANKPFHVFIVLPILPNGDVGETYVEPIRHAQWKTMKWMMSEIEKSTNEFWGNHLSFFFYGQWLGLHKDYKLKYDDEKISRAELVSYSGRQTMYIHSKLMLVDDKVIINGSANLTERSLAGTYDTELALYQWPSDIDEKACIAEARHFRHSIWQHYFGNTCLTELKEHGFISPENADAIKIIQKTARENLCHYMTSESSATTDTGLLLTWPFVRERGHVGEFVKDCEFIPDTLKKDRNNNNSFFKWYPPDDAPQPKILKLTNTLGMRVFY